MPPPGVSREAMEIHAAAEVVDIHVESFVWTRLLGYRLAARHGGGVLGGRLYSQFDLPRMADGGVDGAVLSIATNPFRRHRRRAQALTTNLQRLMAEVEAHPGAGVVFDYAGYEQARAAGRRPCFLAVQGGNAIDGGGPIHPAISRVTLVHLTNSAVGTTGSPLGRRWGGDRRPGLTAAGRTLVEALDAHRVIVDLAHISRQGFDAALEAHDPSLPAVVSHTGVAAVHPSWRNLDDHQIRAIAATGGVVGIMYHSGFLEDRAMDGRAAAVVRHVAHVIDAGGEDTAALGSDWDGMIITPRDMPTVAELPVITQRMLEQGWSTERITKVLGANYLRVVRHMRPGPAR